MTKFFKNQYELIMSSTQRWFAFLILLGMSAGSISNYVATDQVFVGIIVAVFSALLSILVVNYSIEIYRRIRE